MCITYGFSVIFPGFVIDSTFLTIYFFVGCTLYNAFLLLVLSQSHSKKGDDVAHFFSLLIPAHNEESVLSETLKNILNIDYPSELFEVIVVNDGSVDNTQRIAKRFQKQYSNLKVSSSSTSLNESGDGSMDGGSMGMVMIICKS